ncbi:LytR C-terminal domain-containing protein [Phytoactinopolyspora alkaliphila]|uniref:LytR C-terminal domain-containing protein n=1 Tax=Phytoactinopolyspora alkaliphila TaxID=1783498 RepID=A0A6N9YLQ0_9ACTN|nr:LytR C-terminal domain-containing protein [Phytoactinopolyspora alkaliphila]NED95882.1 LytR C-terminal domain-containing protein [Phytoactinopolyspora alkaliphila]
MESEEPIDEYEAAPRQTWRHVRTGITLLVLVAFVVGAAWYSWNNVVAPTDDDTSTTPVATDCPTVVPTDAPPPEEIELNVYNATSRSGLAQQVASQMRDRGFTIMDVDNDPLGATIEGSAEVRAHPEHEIAASLVATMVPGAVLVPDERENATVDLVLGENFDDLAAEAEPDATADACA